MPDSHGSFSSLQVASADIVGMALFNGADELISWNGAFFDLLALPVDFAERRRPAHDLIRYLNARQIPRIGESERASAAVFDAIRKSLPWSGAFEVPDGEALSCRIVPMYGGGFTWLAHPPEATGCDALQSVDNAAATRRDVLDALDGMVDGFALFDERERLVFCNERYSDFHRDVARTLLPGAKYHDLAKEMVEAGVYEYENACVFDTKRGGESKFEARLSDGRTLMCTDTRTGAGSIVSVRADITEIKNRAEEHRALSLAINEKNIHFDTALNNMAQGLCLFDAEQKLIVCNTIYLEIYGFSAEVVKPGVKLADIMKYSISLGNYRKEDADEALADRPVHAARAEQSLLEQYLADGRVIAVFHQPMRGGGSVATYEDITARKIAEHKLRKHANELEARNKELQNYAYVASHDLQEPLRKIEAFSDRLVKRCGDRIGDDGMQYIDRMQKSAGRMRQLIDDLLSYSRVATRETNLVACDLREVVDAVLEDLEVRIGETGCAFDIGPLPTIEASEIQLRQLFQNLISNSMKFIKPGTPPKVTITAEAYKDVDPFNPGVMIEMSRVRVADNGIGFEQKYAEQIFGIFQRLHGRSAYEGTGIGLATCRRIVERHGGEISAHGEQGVGATFEIALPLKRRQEVGEKADA